MRKPISRARAPNRQTREGRTQGAYLRQTDLTGAGAGAAATLADIITGVATRLHRLTTHEIRGYDKKQGRHHVTHAHHDTDCGEKTTVSEPLRTGSKGHGRMHVHAQGRERTLHAPTNPGGGTPAREGQCRSAGGQWRRNEGPGRQSCVNRGNTTVEECLRRDRRGQHRKRHAHCDERSS